MTPNPTLQCGPYQPASANAIKENWQSDDSDEQYLQHKFGSGNHDTIGMIVIDQNRNIAAGTSTNGARHKIPG